MQQRFLILLFLLVAATISLDLCVLRAGSMPEVPRATHDFLATFTFALGLQQLNMATLCGGLSRWPLVLRLGWIAAIVGIATWMFTSPPYQTQYVFKFVVMIAAEAIIAAWILRIAGYRLMMRGDEPDPLTVAESPLKFSLANLFEFTTTAAAAACLFRTSAEDAVLIVFLLPGFLLSLILTMWAVLSEAPSIGSCVIALTVLLGSLGPSDMWGMSAPYGVLLVIYMLVLRFMDVRLKRLPTNAAKEGSHQP